MLFIALKNLFQEKTRLSISIGGVAFSVLLILILLPVLLSYGKLLLRPGFPRLFRAETLFHSSAELWNKVS